MITGFGHDGAVVTNVTLLPALLTSFGAPGEPERMGLCALAPDDRVLRPHRNCTWGEPSSWLMAGLTAAVANALRLHPIPPQDPEGEAVSQHLRS